MNLKIKCTECTFRSYTCLKFFEKLLTLHLIISFEQNQNTLWMSEKIYEMLKKLKFLFILSQPKQSDRNKASSGHYKQQVDWKFYTKWYKVVGCFLSVWSLRSW